MKYSKWNELLIERGCFPMTGCIAKIIENYATRPGGGAEVRGTRLEIPEFVVDPNTKVPTVTVHNVIWEPSSSYAELKGHTFQTWSAVDCFLVDNPNVIHRSKRSGTSISRFISNTTAADSSTVGLITEKVLKLFNYSGEALEVDFLTGDAIVDWYYDNDFTSHSCMTGERSELVRVWASNENQVGLAVFREPGGKPIARCLCFRPSSSLEPLEDTLPFGPGWYYGRIYAVRTSPSEGYDGPDRAVAFMDSKGMLQVDIPACKGVVPLTQSTYAPFIDKGTIMYKTKEEGSRMYWLPPCESLTGFDYSNGWRESDNNQYGNAWGRRYEEDDDGDNCVTCECCGGSFYGEDMTYVERYGDVCPDCLDSGDFVYTLSGSWLHIDNCSKVVCLACPEEDMWIASDSRAMRHFIHGKYRHLVSAIINDHGEEGFAPEDEVITDSDGKCVWKPLVEREAYKLTVYLLRKTEAGVFVEPCDPMLCSVEEHECVKVRVAVEGEAPHAEEWVCFGAEFRYQDIKALIMASETPLIGLSAQASKEVIS